MKTIARLATIALCAACISHLLLLPLWAEPRTKLGGGGHPQPQFDADIDPADLAELKKHDPFKGKSNAEILAKIRIIRQAVWRAIELACQEDRVICACLKSQFQNDRFYIDFGNKSAAASINTDKIEDCGEEEINLGIDHLPCYDEPIYSRTNGALAVTLMHEGLHARQDFRLTNYMGPNRLRLAKTNEVRHCREIEASELDVRLYCEIETVMDELRKGRKMPDGARGMARALGEAIERDHANNEARKKRAAEELYWEMHISKQFSERLIACRQDHKMAFSNYVADVWSASKVFSYLDTNGWFMSKSYGSGFGPVASIGDSMSRNLAQVTQTTNRTMALNGFGQVYAMSVLPGARKVLFIGTDEANSEGIAVGYEDTDGDYLFEESSRRELFRSLDLAGGVHLARNPANGELMGLNREDNTLLRFRDTDADLFPDFAEIAGEFTLEREDLLYLSFSLDGLTAYASSDFDPAMGGVILSHDEWGVARASELGGYFIAEGVRNIFMIPPPGPAFHGVPLEGQWHLWINGAPQADVHAYHVVANVNNFIGSRILDSSGGGVIPLETPLEAGMTLQLFDDTYNFASPLFTVESPSLRIDRWERALVLEWPGFGFQLEHGQNAGGPFVPVAGDGSPVILTEPTNPQYFYRLRKAEGSATTTNETPCAEGRLLVLHAYSYCNADGYWHVAEDAWYACPGEAEPRRFRISDTPTSQRCSPELPAVNVAGPEYQLLDPTCPAPTPTGEKIVLMECRNGMWDEATYLVYRCSDGQRRISGPVSSVPANPPTRCTEPPPRPAEAR